MIESLLTSKGANKKFQRIAIAPGELYALNSTKNNMAPFTNTKSAHIEITSIYAIVFGISLLVSIGTAFWGGPKTFIFTNNSLSLLIALEILTGAVALIVLKVLGWHHSDFHLKLTPIQAFAGILIFFADYLFYFVANYSLSALDINQSSLLIVSAIPIATSVIVSVINPIFEEFFVVAYTVERLEELHGANFTIVLSAFVRFLYHMYQGPISIWIFFMGLLHAFIYTKWRKLWPLVFAHGILNFIYFGVQ